MTTTQYTRDQLLQNQTFKVAHRVGPATDFAAGADFPIFNVAGVILVSQMFGIVTAVIGGNLLPFLEVLKAVPVATSPLCAVVAAHIGADVVGQMYGWIGTAAGPLLVATNIGMMEGQMAWSGGYVIITTGVINVDTHVAGTGSIDWYMVYLPMPGAVVTVL